MAPTINLPGSAELKARYEKATRELVAHFSAAQSHLDGDTTHLTIEELTSARGRLSAEVDAFLDALQASGERGLRALKGAQTEGFRNDPELSMRDLVSVSRGVGYDGADLSDKQAQIFDRLSNAALRSASEKAVAPRLHKLLASVKNHLERDLSDLGLSRGDQLKLTSTALASPAQGDIAAFSQAVLVSNLPLEPEERTKVAQAGLLSGKSPEQTIAFVSAVLHGEFESRGEPIRKPARLDIALAGLLSGKTPGETVTFANEVLDNHIASLGTAQKVAIAQAGLMSGRNSTQTVGFTQTVMSSQIQTRDGEAVAPTGLMQFARAGLLSGKTEAQTLSFVRAVMKSEVPLVSSAGLVRLAHAGLLSNKTAIQAVAFAKDAMQRGVEEFTADQSLELAKAGLLATEKTDEALALARGVMNEFSGEGLKLAVGGLLSGVKPHLSWELTRAWPRPSGE